MTRAMVTLELGIARIQLAQSVTYVAKPLLYPTQIAVHFCANLAQNGLFRAHAACRGAYCHSNLFRVEKISRYLSFTEWLLLYNIRP